jgi:hypothetical protein
MLTPFNDQRMLSLLLVSSKCCQKPGDVCFYPMLPLDCLIYDWLAGRACRSGRANDYLLVGDIEWKGLFLDMWGVPTVFVRFFRIMCRILIQNNNAGRLCNTVYVKLVSYWTRINNKFTSQLLV